MKLAQNFSAHRRLNSRQRQSGSARPILLAIVCFALGATVTGFWWQRSTHATKETKLTEEGVPLSPGTRSVISRLGAPVEVRFYSLLDPGSVSDSVRAFSDRVSQLLASYEQESGGKIKVTRFTSIANDSQKAATDGLRAFNSDKGDSCYLGAALISNNKKEVLPLLSPDWESAVEPDFSRALSRLIDASAPQRPKSEPAITPETIATVQREVTNLATVSVEDGTRILRDAAIKQFQAATLDMANQLKEAQAKLTQAQANGSAAEQQSAMQQLQQLQAAQTEKLKQIAAQSQAQVDALERLKATNR